MTGERTTIQFTLFEAADGMVIRNSVPEEESAAIGIYDENTKTASLTFTAK